MKSRGNSSLYREIHAFGLHATKHEVKVVVPYLSIALAILVMSCAILAVIKLNLWYRRENAKLSKEERKERDRKSILEDSIW
jgi:hypothetical protein